MRSVLLDTHMALWILEDNPKLPAYIRSAQTREGFRWIFHQTSLWEIQIKYLIGKLRLPQPPQEYLPPAIHESGFIQQGIENEGIFLLNRLPDHHHDPFDRLLIAHALLHAWEVATVDEQWESYPIRLFKG